MTGYGAEHEHGGRWGYLGLGWGVAEGTSTRELSGRRDWGGGLSQALTEAVLWAMLVVCW